MDGDREGEGVTIVSVLLPVHTVSEANIREHWAVRARRTKAQRQSAYYLLRKYKGLGRSKRLTITITRIGARRMDPDNLANSSKHVQDGIADALGIDDGSERIEWRYRQEIGKPYAVRIEIDAR